MQCCFKNRLSHSSSLSQTVLQTVIPVSNKIRNKILTKPMHSAGTRVHQSNKSNYLINIHLEQMPLATQVLKSTSPTYSRMLIYMLFGLHAHKHCATWVKAITMYQNHYTRMTERQKPPTTSLKYIFHKTTMSSLTSQLRSSKS